MRKKLLLTFFILIFMFNINSFIISSIAFATNNDVQTYSEACLLMEASSGRVLYEKNSSKRLFPASTTKIITAILTLENCDLSDVATVSQNAVNSIPYSYSTAYLKPGEQFTVEQLLYLLLVPSANDAAVVLAEFVGGSVESFASMMNTKAIELGCTNTHFVNPNGVHYVDPNGNSDLDHFSCAYDLALMGKYAMQNPVFREIVKTTKYTLPPTELFPENRVFSTTNSLLANKKYFYEFANGIKTGYTDPAGDCIVASSKKDDMEYIVVILNGDDLDDGSSARYTDCKTLFDYAFNNFSNRLVINSNSILQQVSISNATSETKDLDVVVKNDIVAFSNNSTDLQSIEPTVILNDNLLAPISKGDVIGKVSYTIDDVVYSSDLIAGFDVAPSEFFRLLFDLAIFALILIFLRMMVKKKKYKAKRRKK